MQEGRTGGGGTSLALGAEPRFQGLVHRPVAESTVREVAEAVATAAGSTVARLGLRCDHVVARVMDRVERYLSTRELEGLTVVLALTAPICAPGRTAAALQEEVDALLRTGGVGSKREAVLYGNRAELRLAKHSPARARRLLGLVHNADLPAAQVLDLAELWLRSDA